MCGFILVRGVKGMMSMLDGWSSLIRWMEGSEDQVCCLCGAGWAKRGQIRFLGHSLLGCDLAACHSGRPQILLGRVYSCALTYMHIRFSHSQQEGKTERERETPVPKAVSTARNFVGDEMLSSLVRFAHHHRSRQRCPPSADAYVFIDEIDPRKLTHQATICAGF